MPCNVVRAELWGRYGVLSDAAGAMSRLELVARVMPSELELVGPLAQVPIAALIKSRTARYDRD
eukprot:5507428-Amphidinium_carterae.1